MNKRGMGRALSIHQKKCRISFGARYTSVRVIHRCALSTGKYGITKDYNVSALVSHHEACINPNRNPTLSDFLINIP
jgi:hypothetical protein